MNNDVSYENEMSDSSWSSAFEGEQGSQASILNREEAREDSSSERSDEEEKSLVESFLQSMEFEPNKTTQIGSQIMDDQTMKQEEMKQRHNLPEIYNKLTRNLLKCSEKWFDCREKIKEIEEFEGFFLKTFSFSYQILAWGEFRDIYKNQPKYKPFKPLFPADFQELKYLKYDSSIDEVFIASKDLYIDIEILDKKLHFDLMDELWSHMRRVCEESSLVDVFSIRSISYKSKNKSRKKILIVERLDSPYKIILRPTKHLSNDLFYFQNALVSSYAKVDERFRILAAFLTIWGTRRGLLSDKGLALMDLYSMLIFFFINNGYLPSLQSKAIWKLPDKQVEFVRLGHQKKDQSYVLDKKKVDFAFETDETNIKTWLCDKAKGKYIPEKNIGMILTKFFYFFGHQLPLEFESCQTRAPNSNARQKHILLDVKTGKKLVRDFHFEIERISFKKYGDRDEIDKGYFIIDPFLEEVTNKKLIGRLKIEEIVRRVKEFTTFNPYEDPEVAFSGIFYEKLELELLIAYKRIIAGNGKEIFDKIDYKNFRLD